MRYHFHDLGNSPNLSASAALVPAGIWFTGQPQFVCLSLEQPNKHPFLYVEPYLFRYLRLSELADPEAPSTSTGRRWIDPSPRTCPCPNYAIQTIMFLD